MEGDYRSTPVVAYAPVVLWAPAPGYVELLPVGRHVVSNDLIASAPKLGSDPYHRTIGEHKIDHVKPERRGKHYHTGDADDEKHDPEPELDLELVARGSEI